MSLASKPITKPADLKGKTIGVGASDDPAWYAFLKVNNIDKSELTTVPASFDLTPLIDGKIDGYMAFLNDEVPQLTAKGIKTAVLRFADYGMPSFSDVYAVTGASLSDATARKQIVAFLAGEIQGWTVALKDPKLGAQADGRRVRQVERPVAAGRTARSRGDQRHHGQRGHEGARAALYVAGGYRGHPGRRCR